MGHGRGGKKFARSRTGCLTCRKRRVKCDEKRPVCERCQKGPRVCIYTAARTAKASNYQLRACCQSDSPDFEFELDERKSVVKFASAVTLETLDILTRDTPDAPMAPRFSLHPDYPGSSAGPWDVFEPEGFEALVVPRPVSPHQCKAVRFFLNFHRETITSAHDFRWYDYPRLHTELIFAMGEESDALQYAICAFSALVYSVRVQQPIKELAFAFYAKALQQLRRSIDSSLVAVATSLELCAFERFFGDAAKAFRHIQGASKIMLQTDPVTFCSTILGRALLEWYMQNEDYCCFLGAFKLLLPKVWRDENVRQHIGDDEESMLSRAWAQFLAFVPRLNKVVHGVRSLRTGKHKSRTALDLHNEIRKFQSDIESIIPPIQILLQPRPVSLSKHQDCCPEFPFIPYVTQFPLAAIFRIVVVAINCYIYSTVYPPIILELIFPITLPPDLSLYSIEVCRLYAGLEEIYELETLLPLFTQLILATATCPVELRKWLWCKLAHLEELGMALDPVRKSLARFWDMPEIVAERKSSGIAILTYGDIERSIKEIKLEEVEDGSPDDSDLESITQALGLSKLS